MFLFSLFKHPLSLIMTRHIVIRLIELAFDRSQIHLQSFECILLVTNQLLQLDCVEHVEQCVANLVLNLERYILVEVFISGCEILYHRQIIDSPVDSFDLSLVDLDAGVHGSKLVHLLLDETSSRAIVHLHSSQLVYELLDLDIELIFVIGDFILTLHLRVLNKSLQLSDIKSHLVSFGLHDNLLLEERLILFVDHLTIALHVFDGFGVLSLLVHLVSLL